MWGEAVAKRKKEPPQLHPALEKRIKDLAAQMLSRSEIRRIIGCDWRIIHRALGWVKPRLDKAVCPDLESPPERCEGCGHIVHMPCLKCHLVSIGKAKP